MAYLIMRVTTALLNKVKTENAVVTRTLTLYYSISLTLFFGVTDRVMDAIGSRLPVMTG
jgi:hypothetical protein